MRILTAIDILGLQAEPLDEWSHVLVCPWCGDRAWAAADVIQCFSPFCPQQASSPEDLIARHLGGYKEGEEFLAKHFNRPADLKAAAQHQLRREVLDLWLSFCLQPPPSSVTQMTSRMVEKGFGLNTSCLGAVAIDHQRMSSIVEVAMRTGATIPDSWLGKPPSGACAFCVQTSPHTVDRIVLLRPNGKIEEAVWNRYAAGINSLLGLRPGKLRLLAANAEMALRLQHDLSALGRHEEVAGLHLDPYQGWSSPRWELQDQFLTAVPRYFDPRSDPKLHGPDDIVRIQAMMDRWPGIERSIGGLTMDHVLNLRSRRQSVPWSSLRFAMIASLIRPTHEQVPPMAASLFEQTGTREEDTAALVAHFSRSGNPQLVEDIELLSLNRVIYRDRGAVLKETATDYRIVRGPDTAPLANFNLRIHANVTFAGQQSPRYCQGTLRCGEATTEVLFPQSTLNDRVQNLEWEVQKQLLVAGLTQKAGKMPTIIEVSKFRQFIIPHLRAQAARAKPVTGVDSLGWSENRRAFTFPGFVVTAEGSSPTSRILCPAVPVLSHYRAVPEEVWAESCPQQLDRSCHDLVAMLVASSVRYFRRSITQPILVAQSSAAMSLLDRITAAFGQREIHSLNVNVREGNRIEGVHGYPLLTAGPRVSTFHQSQLPFLLLTDSGYAPPTDPDRLQLESAARAAQYCFRRIIEWCLRTGGDEFRECPSLAHHRSLLREGRWLIEHVCDIDDWEVSQGTPTALENLFAQIPYEEAGRRIKLIDGQELVIDLHDLEHDHDGILREVRDMGTIAAIQDGQVISPAAKLVPAIATFYGQDPDFTLIASP